METNTSSTANVSEDGSGHLNITAVNSGGSWTSGRIETVADSFEAPAGGEMEVSASIKQPNPSSGARLLARVLDAGRRVPQPAARARPGTMDCSNWPSTGEIDVMEDVNALSEHSGTLHCGTDPGGPCNETTGLGSGLQACSGCQTGYNTYSVIVNRTNTSDESITWYLNGTAYYTVTESQVGTATWQAAVDHGFFLILDLAIGGAYPNAVCGCTSPTSVDQFRRGDERRLRRGLRDQRHQRVAPSPSPSASASPSPSPATAGAECQHDRDRRHLRRLLQRPARQHLVTAATGDSSPSGVDGNQAAAAFQRRLAGVSGHQLRLGIEPVRCESGLRRGRRGERAGGGGAGQPVEHTGRQLRGG